MTDGGVNEARNQAAETCADAAAEKAFENEGGRPYTRTACAPEPIMERIERSAGRIKARLAARSGR